MTPLNEEKTPLNTVRELLRATWRDNTAEEAEALWRRYVEQSQPWAAAALASLDAVLADPPANLGEIMQEEGWIMLSHEPDAETVIPYTHEENLAWLRRMTAEYKQTYQDIHGAGA
jgi:hypothetical protein